MFAIRIVSWRTFAFCVGNWIIIMKLITGQFVVQPQNTVVLVGDGVSLQCAVNDTLIDSTSINDWVYTGNETKQSAAATAWTVLPNESDRNLMNLYTNSSQSTQAGLYACVNRKDLRQASAQLIVIDDEPRCESAEPSCGTVTLTCCLNYSGLWVPSARWIPLDSQVENASADFIHKKISNVYVLNKRLCFIKSVAVTTESRNSSYRCTVFFDLSQKPKNTTASNVPSSNLTCTATANHNARTSSSLPCTTVANNMETTVYNADPQNSKTWIYVLVAVTVSCVLLMIVNTSLIIKRHLQTAHDPKPQQPRTSTPDLLHSEAETDKQSVNPSHLLAADVHQTAIEMEQFTNIDLYAELAPSETIITNGASSSHSRPSDSDRSQLRASSNAVYASIDHTVKAARSNLFSHKSNR